ncbi:intestinal mucin-like protein [Pyxicephalus adspersus]|uniref:intestinal mucin-like protein n=1 Tax=Pyxicephalus adspersus TaxID=30357 RepID=UPI003B5A167B
MPKCGSGYRVVSFLPPGACCVNITCVPDSVCVYGTDVYQRGSVIPQSNDACQKCECSYDMDKSSGFYAIKCSPIICNTTCIPGYEYKTRTGQCCGECVPKQCTMKGENNTNVDIEVGKTYRNTNNKCSYYECNEIDGQPVLTKVQTVCQVLDLTKCDLNTVKYDVNGCCKTCEPRKDNRDVTTPSPGSLVTSVPKIPEDCGVRTNVTVLKEDDCQVTVELNYCGGPCMGSSMYSIATKNMDHSCSCCSELEVGEKSVEMVCANGTRRLYTYKNVLRCGCVSAYCTPNNSLVASSKYSRENQNRR